MDIFVTTALLIGTIVTLFFYLVRKQKHFEGRGIPTAKNYIPIIGHFLPFFMYKKTYGEVLNDIYNTMSSCSMVGIYNFNNSGLLIRDPNLVKVVMQTNFNSFPMTTFKIDPERDLLMSKNPFFQMGEKWKKDRSVLSNALSSAKLKNMVSGINQVNSRFVDYLNKNIKSHGGAYEVKSEVLFGRFTSEVVAKVGFGIDGNCFKDEPGNFYELAKKLFEPSGVSAFQQTVIFFFPFLSKVFDIRFVPKHVDQYLRSVVREVLEAREKSGIKGNDFVQQIYDSFKAEFKSNQLDDIFVTGHSVSFMLDGYFTSSMTLATIIYELATHPDIQEKLRNEVKQVLARHENQITYDSIQDMKYMDLVIQESMRMIPVVSVLSRECHEPCKLVGDDGLECIMKPGDTISISPMGLQKDPKYWSNPEDFNPDRFREEFASDSLYKFIYLPFGAGPKVCVGMRMALLQMKAALATLLDKYKVDLSPKTKLPLTFDYSSFLNIVLGGIWINIKPL